jgi:hypothetical protein
METMREHLSGLTAQIAESAKHREGQYDAISHRLRDIEIATGQHRAATDELTIETRGMKEQIQFQNGRVAKLEAKEEHRSQLEQMQGWYDAGRKSYRRQWVERWQRCLDWAGNGTVRTVLLGLVVALLGALGLLGVADTLREWLP